MDTTAKPTSSVIQIGYAFELAYKTFMDDGPMNRYCSAVTYDTDEGPAKITRELCATWLEARANVIDMAIGRRSPRAAAMRADAAKILGGTE